MIACIHRASARPFLLHQYRRHRDEVVLDNELLWIDKFECLRSLVGLLRLCLSYWLWLGFESLLIQIVEHWADTDVTCVLLSKLHARVRVAGQGQRLEGLRRGRHSFLCELSGAAWLYSFQVALIGTFIPEYKTLLTHFLSFVLALIESIFLWPQIRVDLGLRCLLTHGCGIKYILLLCDCLLHPIASP